MSESNDLTKNLLEIGTLYHSLLFSYQRALKYHQGAQASIYIHPTIDHLLKMDQEGGLKLENSKTFEEAINAFTDFLSRSKIVKTCRLTKLEEDKYAFKVEGCIWAGKVHDRQVNLNDVTCPYAIVAMALYKKYKGFISEEAESEYFSNGTETIIAPALT